MPIDPLDTSRPDAPGVDPEPLGSDRLATLMWAHTADGGQHGYARSAPAARGHAR